MKRMLLGYDGSDSSRRAAAFVADLALHLGGEVLVLVVGELAPGGYLAASSGAFDAVSPVVDPEAYERLVDEGVELIRSLGATAQGRMEWGSPADRILEVATEGEYELIALGHRGTGGLESLLLGSVAKHVMDGATGSVLMVR